MIFIKSILSNIITNYTFFNRFRCLAWLKIDVGAGAKIESVNSRQRFWEPEGMSLGTYNCLGV